MKDCHWLTPLLVAEIEFTEWTPDAHLRHASFAGLRDDKEARNREGIIKLREHQFRGLVVVGDFSVKFLNANECIFTKQITAVIPTDNYRGSYSRRRVDFRFVFYVRR